MKAAYPWLLVVLALCLPEQGSTTTPPKEFLLTVTLSSPMKSVVVSAKVLLGQPFETSTKQADRQITIKGMLTAVKQHQYHLRLKIVDWASEKTNTIESYEPDLILGEPWTGAFISSFIYKRTVLLTRVADR